MPHGRRTGLPLAALLAIWPAACVADSLVTDERIRFGSGASIALTTIKLDRDSVNQTVPDLKDGTGESFYVEAGVQGQEGDLLLARFVYAETEHEVTGFATDAEVRQWMLQTLWSPVQLGPGRLRFRPLLGVAAGAMQI